jgi:hypothetical protein
MGRAERTHGDDERRGMRRRGMRGMMRGGGG